MKNYHAWILYVVSAGFGASAFGADLPNLAGPQVTERGPHHRKLIHVSTTIGANGASVLKTNRYTEVATGLHYQHNGEWLETKEVIDLVPGGGALASQGPHQVGFAANLNTPGAINLLMPNGQRMRSHILGLAYTDTRTGQSVLIAQVRDSIGTLVGDNQVVYPDAFDTNAVRADVRYTYTRSGFEQDVILRATPPSPESFGLESATTRLEVFTEFLEAPTPETQTTVLARTEEAQRGGMVVPDFTDTHLDFGPMQIIAGHAFPLGERDEEIPTGKTWEHLADRRVLIEAVPYLSIKAQLDALGGTKKEARLLPKAGKGRSFPSAPRQAGQSTNSIQRTAALSNRPGFVLDYLSLIGSFTNFTFAGDQTYFVRGLTLLYGTSVLEGGTVIKFTNAVNIAAVRFQQNVDCQTSPNHPAVFTSMHDNTVGETIATSSGTPTNYCGFAMLYLNFFSGSSRYYNLHDLRVSYADRAFYGISTVNADIRNCQVTHTRVAFRNITSFWNYWNVLAHDVREVFDGTTPHTNSAEHLTLHSVSNFMVSGLSAVNLTNSLLIGVTNNVSYVGTGVETNLSDAGIFQTVGAGAHYLADPSPYRDVGTTNINAALQTDLRKRTTYPPEIIAPSNGYYGVSQTLFPRAGRDTDTPDLGYHYPPLDYAISYIYLTNATIQVDPGTTIAVFNPTNSARYGLAISDGATFLAEGRADSKITVTHYATVQEMANTNWAGPITALLYTWDSPGGTPELRVRFTDFTTLGGTIPLLSSGGFGVPWHLTDCQFHSGSIESWGALAMITNSLFNRNSSALALIFADTTNYFYNCTFYGGAFNNWLNDSNQLRIHDSLFVGTTNLGDAVASHNGYTTNGNSRLTPNHASDQIINSLVFESGPLGRFYVATNSALYNAGSRYATNAGLYHYTMLTNNVKETNSVVDIGFHYVATDANGTPLDGDGDGVPDYWEDRNGNGSADLTETSWLNYDTDGDGVWDGLEILQGRNPLGGTLTDTLNLINLRVFTPLR